MLIIVDCEGDPIQEFSALYVNKCSETIVDVFHRHVKYPFIRDADWFARRYVHGLDREYLNRYGLHNEAEVVLSFSQWLTYHPYDAMYANAPNKERRLLSKRDIIDVGLPPWKKRVDCISHQRALLMKLNHEPVCGVVCRAHCESVCWKPKHVNKVNDTDAAKSAFSHHCSLYDCIECYFFLFPAK